MDSNIVRRLVPCKRCGGHRWEDTGEPAEIRWHGCGFPACICSRADRPEPIPGERLSDREYQDHLNGILDERASVRRLLGASAFAFLVLWASPMGLTLPYLFLAGLLYMTAAS